MDYKMNLYFSHEVWDRRGVQVHLAALWGPSVEGIRKGL